MNKHTLHRTVSNLSCFQEISSQDYIYLTVFYLYVTFVELKWLSLNHFGKAHTSIYISELRTVQVTYSTKTLV